MVAGRTAGAAPQQCRAAPAAHSRPRYLAVPWQLRPRQVQLALARRRRRRCRLGRGRRRPDGSGHRPGRSGHRPGGSGRRCQRRALHRGEGRRIGWRRDAVRRHWRRRARQGRSRGRRQAGAGSARRCGQRGRGRWRHGALTEQGGRRCGRRRVVHRRRRGEIVGMGTVGDQALGDRRQFLLVRRRGFRWHGGKIGIRGIRTGRRRPLLCDRTALQVVPPGHRVNRRRRRGTSGQQQSGQQRYRATPQHSAQSPPEHPMWSPRRRLPAYPGEFPCRRLNPRASVSRLRALSENSHMSDLFPTLSPLL